MERPEYKTNNVNDTELVYSLLRESYPDKKIEIEYNYNTKEYTLILTNEKYTGDPEVDVDLQIKVVYGDSVTGDTPLLLQKDGQVYIETIQSIFDESKVIEYPNFKMFDKEVRLEKQYSLTDYKVWSDKGWININKVIRHKCDKKIYKILTHSGCVKVTEDHSLLDENMCVVKPHDCNLKTKLLSSYPTTFNENTCEISKDMAYNYGYELCDKVPTEILNSNNDIIGSFLDGYYNKEWTHLGFKFQEIDKNQILYAGLYYLIKKVNNDDKTFFDEIINKNIQNRIKKIELLENDKEQFVYDLETDLGRFQAGVGDIIVKNTDSIFLEIKFNRDDFEKNREDSFKMAQICGDNITDKLFNRKPIVLEFEKVYQPFVLLTKKRYIGKKFEDTRDPFKLKEMTTAGIALTRRDYCKMVKNCYKEVIDTIMDTNDIEFSIDIFKKYIDKIEHYQIDFDDLVVSAMLAKNYSCSQCKEKVEWYNLRCSKKGCTTINKDRKEKCPKCNTPVKCMHKFSLAHVNLAMKLLSRNEDIQINDRIQYLFVENAKVVKGASLKSELAEEPKYATENNLTFNRMCYLEQLAKPIAGFFKIILKDDENTMDELITFVNEKLVEFGGKKLRPSDYKLEE